MTNDDIAEILDTIGQLLELKGENPFKTRAYGNGARALQGLSEPVIQLIERDELKNIDGIGKALLEKITTLAQTGTLPYYENLRAEFPEGILELLSLNGLGPKKAKALYTTLNVGSLDDLEAACQSGKVASLSGFGKKTAEKLLGAIEQHRQYSGQFRYADVIERAEDLVALLRTHPDVIRISIAGSLRRGKEVVKDMDLIASSNNPNALMTAFVEMDDVENVINHGETKSSVRLSGGLQCDLRVVDDETYPAALHHFTGSKEHNVIIRRRAKEKKLKVSEWGVIDTSGPKEKKLPCRDEAELFNHLDLNYISPELRENMGEIEASTSDSLPKLVEWEELRGCFHNHTTASDGKNTLQEMAEAAASVGLEYFGISDHSKSSVQANGLSEDRLLSQIEEIRELNRELSRDIHVFSGVECDILKDGSLDYSDEILAQLDYVVASVHSSFTLSEKEQTRRICKAMDNPYVTMLGHPTGRILLEREAYALNMEKVLKHAAKTGTWVELNASPYRLDLDWRHWKTARDLGVRCVINPDAHRVSQIGSLKPAISIARKGWLRKKDIINCLTLREIEKEFAVKRNR
ncbi:MAG: DNA polymerase/3'-5' exonuclease PolX [Verrucomicrobiota bacterium]